MPSHPIWIQKELKISAIYQIPKNDRTLKPRTKNRIESSRARPSFRHRPWCCCCSSSTWPCWVHSRSCCVCCTDIRRCSPARRNQSDTCRRLDSCTFHGGSPACNEVGIFRALKSVLLFKLSLLLLSSSSSSSSSPPPPSPPPPPPSSSSSSSSSSPPSSSPLFSNV